MSVSEILPDFTARHDTVLVTTDGSVPPNRSGFRGYPKWTRTLALVNIPVTMHWLKAKFAENTQILTHPRILAGVFLMELPLSVLGTYNKHMTNC